MTQSDTDVKTGFCFAAVLPLSIFMDKDTHDLILLENLKCPETRLNQNKSQSSLYLHGIPFQLPLFCGH